MRLGADGIEVEPWMMSRIRLADRRGLLRGKVSQIQSDAAEILSIFEINFRNAREKESVRRHYQILKATLVEARPEAIKAKFPEWYPETSTSIDDEDPEAEKSWEYTGETPSLETIQDLLGSLKSTNTAHLDKDGGWV